MFAFDNDITVRLRNGRTLTRREWSLALLDLSDSKTVYAMLMPVTKRILLWRGAAYDAAGDYTQAQAEARLREVLGDDPASALSEPVPVLPLP